MKKSHTDIKTPLSVAKGMGSAKSGTHHFIMERLSALASIPLLIWFIYSLISLITTNSADPDVSFIQTREWVADPVNTVLLVVFIISVFYHSALGLQVVIEDYMHKPMVKYTTLVTVHFLSFILAASSVIAVLRIAFA